jgi:outer membrane protein assembly factor BamB
MSVRRAWSSWLLLAAIGCGAGSADVDYGRYDGTSRRSAGPGLHVRWTKPLAPEWGGPYIPVERAAAAIDPVHERMYVGSSQRELYAFDVSGRELYRFEADSSIEAAPTLDARSDELYVASASGRVTALDADDGNVRWNAELGATVSRPGVLSEDAIYLVTDNDGVFALSRKDGSVLWRYQRDPRAGLKITGHAGLASAEQTLVTGFSDGAIVALAKGDGRALWVVDTTLDLTDSSQAETGFVDVDTTPAIVGDIVYAASFLAGLYGIRMQDGVTQFRNAELTGVTSLTADERTLSMVSAERGVSCYDLPALTQRWSHNVNIRGAANSITLENRTLFVTESRGALLALAIADGHELGRLQTEHGFAATPSLRQGQGAILGNSGILYAFDY